MSLSKEEVSELQEIFNLVDKDGGGSISNEELKDLMDTVGIKASQEDVDKMIKEIDQDSNGEVDFDEFVAVMSRKVNNDITEEQVKEAFDYFSSAKDGTISKSELKKVLLTECSKKLSMEETVDVLAKLEFDTNNKLNYINHIDKVLGQSKT